jgi:hypothetical protein
VRQRLQRPLARLGHTYPRRRASPAEVTKSASILTSSAVSTRSRRGCPLSRRYRGVGNNSGCRHSRARMLLGASPSSLAVSLTVRSTVSSLDPATATRTRRLVFLAFDASTGITKTVGEWGSAGGVPAVGPSATLHQTSFLKFCYHAATKRAARGHTTRIHRKPRCLILALMVPLCYSSSGSGSFS